MNCYSSDILVGSIDGVAFSKTKYKIQSKISGKDSPWEKVRHDELDPVTHFSHRRVHVYVYMAADVVIQFLSCVQLFVTSWAAARQVSLSSAISRSLLKFMPIEFVMSSSHFILCCLLLLLPSIFPSIRLFSSESALHIRWSKY